MSHLRGLELLTAVAVAASLLGRSSTSGAQGSDHSEEGVTYPDTPTDAYYAGPLAELAEQGVFAGTLCEDGFCPEEPVDRKTMAVWVVRVLDGRDPSAVSESRFSDVDADGFEAPFIERMFELGVTQGCGDGSGFCPDDPVTRAQMAVFLSRAFDLPEGRDPGFSDVPADAWYAADVAKLAASSITRGCGDGCPWYPTPSGRYTAIRDGCGQKTESIIECLGPIIDPGDFGPAHFKKEYVPKQNLIAVSASNAYACGLRPDQTLLCWGDNRYGATNAPEGEFVDVAVARNAACALRSDGTVACWDGEREWEPLTGQLALPPS